MRLSSTLLALAVAGFLAPAAGAIPEWQGCDNTAHASLMHGRAEAQADFWLSLTRSLADPETSFTEGLQEAWSEREEALEEAEAKYEAQLAVCAALGHVKYNPDLDPLDFSENITNQYLPYTPGKTLIYEKMTPDGLERIEVTTLNDTIEVDGFLCRVVQDIAYLNGEVIEDTHDWFAQDLNGDVWYFGEIALNYEDGFLDNLDGSWRTGRDDALPGVIMFQNPVIGTIYREEYLPQEAEDVAKIVDMGVTVDVPYGTFTNCLKVMAWTPLEPDAVEEKYYAPGVGVVLEVDTETGERLELIQIQ
ncbi:MAG: hypothetical protein DWQ01_08880 [Planctomycetota bacterium]|nr:MAG: hypothetical protein DWQ01_08880 [Planctomycetota bacterium]